MKKTGQNIGSSLEDFLEEEGIQESSRATALKEAETWRAAQKNESAADEADEK